MTMVISNVILPCSASKNNEHRQYVNHLQERHEPRDETITSPLKDVQETGQERCTNSETNGPALDKISEEEQRCCLVKSMLLF